MSALNELEINCLAVIQTTNVYDLFGSGHQKGYWGMPFVDYVHFLTALTTLYPPP